MNNNIFIFDPSKTGEGKTTGTLHSLSILITSEETDLFSEEMDADEKVHWKSKDQVNGT
jgi:hypothetical protein